MKPYSRSCPKCDSKFDAVSDRGICPVCNTFSRVSINGELIVLLDAESLAALPHDDPFRDTPLAVLFEWFDSGGGPFVTTTRYAGKPTIAEVHRQLKLRFNGLCELLREYDMNAETETIASPGDNQDWLGTIFSLAKELYIATWKMDHQRYDIVCEITDSGGTIHAIPPAATYHLKSN